MGIIRFQEGTVKRYMEMYSLLVISHPADEQNQIIITKRLPHLRHAKKAILYTQVVPISKITRAKKTYAKCLSPNTRLLICKPD